MPPQISVVEVDYYYYEMEEKFLALNNHGPTRWTTLGPVLFKMAKLWDVFVQYFSNEGPQILRQFFTFPFLCRTHLLNESFLFVAHSGRTREIY